MPLDKQIVSLELAKKLKELGCKQESYFKWVIDEFPVKGRSYIANMSDEIEPGNKQVSAFTVAELMEEIAKTDMNWQVWKNAETNQWHFTNYENTITSSKNENLADSCGAMLVYLLENGLITL